MLVFSFRNINGDFKCSLSLFSVEYGTFLYGRVNLLKTIHFSKKKTEESFAEKPKITLFVAFSFSKQNGI